MIHDNELGANGQQGVWIERSHDNRVEGNEIRGSSGAGVALEGVERQHGHRQRCSRRTAAAASRSASRRAAPTSASPSNDNRRRAATRSSRAAAPRSSSRALEVGRHRQPADRQRRARARTATASRSTTRATRRRGNDVRCNKGGIALKHSSDNRHRGQRRQRVRGRPASRSSRCRSTTSSCSNISSHNDGDGIYVGDETAGGSGIVDRGQHDEQQQGLRHLRAQGQPHRQGQHRQRQRQLGHLGQRGLERPRQHRRRRQHGAGQPRPARPDHAQAAAVLQRSMRRRPAGRRPDRAGHAAPRAPGRPDDATTSRRFRFTGTDNASTVAFQCRLDSSSSASDSAACASPYTATTSLAVGTHTFEVRAVDIVRQRRPDAGDLHLVRSSRAPPGVPPETTIDSAARTLDGRRTDATFEFSSNERGATFECALDGGRRSARLRPRRRTYTGLARRRAHVHGARDRRPTSRSTPRRPRCTLDDRRRAGRRARSSAARSSSQSIMVTNDLIDCPGNGLVVGAARHHDRPRRPHHRRHRARRRHPQHRLRQRHDHERHDHRVRLRRPAQPGHRAERRHRPARSS